MLFGKDALGLGASFVCGLLGLGCFSSAPQARGSRDGIAQPPQPLQKDQLLSDSSLRISDPPKPQGTPVALGQMEMLPLPAAAAQPPSLTPQPIIRAAMPPLASPYPEASPTPSPAAAMTPLQRLHKMAADEYVHMDSYIVRLRRREQVNGKDQPEEIIAFKFRKNPWSLHFRWIGAQGKGREVVFVKGQYGGKIHTRMGLADTFPGKCVALAPDSVFVRRASRHTITEAGVGALIDRFGQQIRSQHAAGNSMTYRGLQQRPEFVTPVEVVQQIVPQGLEPALPHGGQRLWFFDATRHLPVLLITYDDQGHEVEYYCYERFMYPVRLDDNDFNPDKLWKQPKRPSSANLTDN